MGLLDALDFGLDINEARAVVEEGFAEAIDTMENMIGNEGQQTVFDNYVVDAFQDNVGPIKEGWTDVDIGDYMDFMGDIVNEGNSIMADAYAEAQDILSEIEEYAEEFGEGFLDE